MKNRREDFEQTFFKIPIVCRDSSQLLLFSDLEQELADYNGDDENEGEFEADKQAALAQI